MTLEEFFEKLETVLNEPGVITEIHMTYDVINKYQVRMKSNDPSPDTGYEPYADARCSGNQLSQVFADALERYCQQRE